MLQATGRQRTHHRQRIIQLDRPCILVRPRARLTTAEQIAAAAEPSRVVASMQPNVTWLICFTRIDPWLTIQSRLRFARQCRLRRHLVLTNSIIQQVCLSSPRRRLVSSRRRVQLQRI